MVTEGIYSLVMKSGVFRLIQRIFLDQVDITVPTNIPLAPCKLKVQTNA